METIFATHLKIPRLSSRQTFTCAALALALAFATTLAAEAAEGEALAAKLRMASTARSAMAANNSEATAKAFTLATQDAAEAFTKIELKESGSTEKFMRVTLNTHGTRFDGIRFTVPKGEARDLAWAFASLPKHIPSNWYILPRVGVMKGFSRFFRASSGIKGAPWAESAVPYSVYAQPLSGGELKPEQEYLIWFNFSDAQPKDIYVLIKLVPVGTDTGSTAAIHKELDLRYE